MKKYTFAGIASIIWLLTASPAEAKYQRGRFEFSFGVGFNTQSYGGTSHASTFRWGGSFGYFIFPVTEIEIAYQDSKERTLIEGFQDTTFHDRVLSANITQHLVPKHWPVQPYLKLGVGQLNREATGSYAFGGSPAARVDSVTVVMGLGVRIYITRIFAIRTEATSYLTGGALHTWNDNLAFNVGVSLVF